MTSIPLFILGWLPISYAAVLIVIPLALIAVALMVHRSPEAVWAAQGAAAGLVGVFAYDAIRMPLVWAHIWPDFIPQLGGWVLGSPHENALVGYIWRYLGDGAGIGMSFFVVCGALLAIRPSIVILHPMLLAIGYGVCIWSGLLATVALIPSGQTMMFPLSPIAVTLTLAGHLIYGAALGVFLRRAVVSRCLI